MQSLTKQTFKIYWQHSIRYPFVLTLIVIGVLGTTALEVYMPFWYKRFFDALAGGPEGGVGALIGIVVTIAVLNSVSWFFRRLNEFTSNFFQARIISNLLNTCFAYLGKHSFGFFNNQFVGTLVRRVGKFARSFEDIADQLTFSIGPTTLRIVAILGVLAWRSPLLAIVVGGWLIIFTIFNISFARYKLRYDIERSALDSRTTGHLADTVTNQINLKLFNGYGREKRTYERLTEELFQLRRKGWNLGSTADAIQSLLLILLEAAVLYVGVLYWERGQFTVGDFALLQSYLIQIFYRVWDIGRFVRKIYESLADANEMTEILLTPHEVTDSPDAGALKVGAGAIAFSDITFGYPGQKPVFKKFSLAVASGERVALIGPSGGGKSTIVKLLLRFHNIQSGKISIDGQEIAKVTQDSLRASIALVPQEPILFHRSLFENIRYARPNAGREEVIRAAKLAHAHEFIKNFPEGYETFVGERGVKLSGGERQRVAIARAILKDAPILVLDEATSSLDSESERYIQDALKNLMKKCTTIVIAHRLSTIMQMDRIVVIENGRVVEEGTHQQLLEVKQGTYQRLWEIQAGGFA